MTATMAEQVGADGVASSPGFAVEGLTVQFGGLNAVSDVSLQAPGGAITGLIGPNGAGKSTTFNAATGIVRPTHGTVRLGDAVLDGMRPAARAQRGLGRTFQRMELFGRANVRQNVELGLEAHLGGRRLWGQLWNPASERALVEERSQAALDRCGLAGIAERRVGELSTGQRRLVELARVLATGFSFLLLDEPSSGLDEAESEEFARILLEVADEGTGILIVEHDMALVRRACSYLYVLDFGELITEGETDDVLASDEVRAAYLGAETV